MPRYVRLAAAQEVEAAIDVFGNRVRVEILRFLRQQGPSMRSEIADGVEAGAPTVLYHLRALAELGVVGTDPPLAEARRGSHVRWFAIEDRLFSLYSTLGSFYGYGATRESVRSKEG